MKRFADGPDIISRFLRENAWVSGCSTSDSPFQHNACEIWLKQMHVASRWYLGTCNAHILLLLSYIPVRLILAPREIKPKLAELGGMVLNRTRRENGGTYATDGGPFAVPRDPKRQQKGHPLATPS